MHFSESEDPQVAVVLKAGLRPPSGHRTNANYKKITKTGFDEYRYLDVQLSGKS